MSVDKKTSGAVAVVIAIIVILILIYLFFIKKRVAPSCPEGTDIYMHLELGGSNQNFIALAYYDQLAQAVITALIPKQRELGIFIHIMNEALFAGQIVQIQYNCAMWQYDILVPREA